MKTPTSLAARIAILIGVLTVLVLATIGGSYALGLGPWRGHEPAKAEDQGDPTPFEPAPAGGEVVATADGEPIYLADVRSRIQGLSAMHGEIQDSLGEDWHEVVLQSVVDDALIVAEADRRDIVVTRGEIAASVERIRGMFETEAEFGSWLEDQGMGIEDLERRIWLQTIAARVYLAVTEDVTVTGEELRSYYRNHRDEFEGADGFITPFIAVRVSLRQDLLKDKQDQAYAAWLEEARAAVEVVVLDEGWWKELP